MIAAPQSSEQPRNDFNAAPEIDPMDVPKIFRCGFKVVDDQLKDKKNLLEVWNEYKPFLEFLTSKVEACIKKNGESEAQR